MDKLKYIKLENEDGSYSSSIPLAVDSDHVDVEGSTLTTVLEDKANMANINNLQSEINSLASGSPKGSYATTAALISANPDTGVYIVQADGHIYSWTKDASSAIDLGVYQAADIKDNPVIEDLYDYIQNGYAFNNNNTWWANDDGSATLHTGTAFPLLYSLKPIKVKVGDTAIVTTGGTGTANTYYIVDKDYNVLRSSQSTTAKTYNISIEDPEAVYLLINFYNNGSVTFKCEIIPRDFDNYIDGTLRFYEISPMAPQIATFWAKVDNKVMLRGNAGTFSWLRAINKIACKKGDIFKIKASGDGNVVAYYIVDENYNLLSQSQNTSFNGILTISDNDAAWLLLNKNSNTSFKVVWLEPNFQDKLDYFETKPTIKWSIPSKIYAVVNQNKTLYLDNLTNKNLGASNLTIGINTNDISSSGFTIDNEKINYLPTSTGNKTLPLTVYDSLNNITETKNIIIETISNTLNKKINICCIGDSITEGKNMPYYAKQKINSFLASGSIMPDFVGTKGGPSGMANKDCYHEGWYGRSLQFLASNSESPFVNNGQLDITNYRNNHINLSNDTIDVVSIAMGWNGTGTDTDRNNSFTAMNNIMNAFLADNPNTVFIIQMLTYPSNAEGDYYQTARCNQNQLWRDKILTNYEDVQVTNVLLGDMGNCYDRKRGYPTATKDVSPYYTGQTIVYSTDFTHPSVAGTQQLGENLAYGLFKAAQLAATLKD